MTTPTEPGRGLYRLFAWLSPGFPTGAFSYSHGLEAAASDGAVRDRDSLERRIAAIVIRGSGRVDADILCDAYAAAKVDDPAAFAEANRRGLAYRGTAELALESGAQGEAMRATLDAAWAVTLADAAPHPDPLPANGESERIKPLTPLAERGRRPSRQRWEGEGQAAEETCQAAIVGWAAARAGASLGDALVLYLQSFSANLVAAGLRLGLIGQTDGQRIIATLEPVITEAAAAAITRSAADFGAATVAVDLASMAHETLYTRLFRS